MGQKGDIENMKIQINSAIVLTMLLVIPATIGMMSLAEPIIKLVYQRGAFDNKSVVVTASMLIAYAPFVIFQSFSDVIDKGFYAVGDSKSPFCPKCEMVGNIEVVTETVITPVISAKSVFEYLKNDIDAFPKKYDAIELSTVRAISPAADETITGIAIIIKDLIYLL